MARRWASIAILLGLVSVVGGWCVAHYLVQPHDSAMAVLVSFVTGACGGWLVALGAIRWREDDR